MNSRVLSYIGIALLWGIIIGVFSGKELSSSPELKELPDGIELVTKVGRIEGFYKDIYVVSLDSEKTWLIITPTLEVVGYLHKRLPQADISTFRKLERIPNGPHFKFYYKGLL